MADGTTPPSHADRPVSLRDVAKLANVSVATVSMVVNDNPRISRATAVRVRQIIDQTGYRPNRLAQGLSSRYTRSLAVLLPPLRHAFGDPYFGEMISGVCDRAGKLGYKVMLEQAKPEFVREGRHLEMYDRRYVDGVLAMGFTDRHPFLTDFAADRRRYPVIMVDNTVDRLPELDHVVCNYRLGAGQVMNYLAQLGHRRIGLVHGAPEVRTARDVIDAHRDKLVSLGVDDADVQAWRADGRYTQAGGAAATDELLDRHPDLTAVFAGDDKMAMGVLRQLRRRGLDVPAQVSVVGFYDLPQSAHLWPTLTTVHLPLYEIGAVACERLVERVHGTVDRVAEVLPTHLVVRESTAMAADVAAVRAG